MQNKGVFLIALVTLISQALAQFTGLEQMIQTIVTAAVSDAVAQSNAVIANLTERITTLETRIQQLSGITATVLSDQSISYSVSALTVQESLSFAPVGGVVYSIQPSTSNLFTNGTDPNACCMMQALTIQANNEFVAAFSNGWDKFRVYSTPPQDQNNVSTSVAFFFINTGGAAGMLQDGQASYLESTNVQTPQLQFTQTPGGIDYSFQTFNEGVTFGTQAGAIMRLHANDWEMMRLFPAPTNNPDIDQPRLWFNQGPCLGTLTNTDYSGICPGQWYTRDPFGGPDMRIQSGTDPNNQNSATLNFILNGWIVGQFGTWRDIFRVYEQPSQNAYWFWNNIEGSGTEGFT
ncbi:hypothetical protein HK100_007745 [Physocladia obscura]|uniref:Uncharacterized protein n=1 Tax=Physocladia obscura TaxID=109957 RepID=A0AAD5XJX9_9FUNG|nr:hypothetical protein HK100_007745 [Physocladia obscura]